MSKQTTKMDNKKKIIYFSIIIGICCGVVIRACIETGLAITTLIVSTVGLGAIIIASSASLLTIIYSVLSIIGAVALLKWAKSKLFDSTQKDP